jgi:6-phosphogluconolactonase
MKNPYALITAFMMVASSLFAQKEFVYIGTYSIRDSKGIYVYAFDRATATLNLVETASDLTSPSFLEIHPSGKFLYAASELDHDGAAGSFALDQTTGKLKFINQQSSKGGGACHVAIDKTGKFALVSNYGAGTLAVLPIQANGSLSPASDVIVHTGNSVNKERQEKAHVHSAFFSPDNKYVFVSDLGTDEIYQYQLNHTTGKVIADATKIIRVSPGAGPRHLVFHPNGKYFYSVEELTSTVAVLAYNKQNGHVKIINDTIKALPDSFKGFTKSADIHIDPSGKFLYYSHRGLNTLAIFSIADDGASIKLIGQQDVMGESPRNFLIDPKGEFAFVANQDTDNIVIFKVDKSTGLLTYTGNQIKVPAPVCIKMLSK